MQTGQYVVVILSCFVISLTMASTLYPANSITVGGNVGKVVATRDYIVAMHWYEGLQVYQRLATGEIGVKYGFCNKPNMGDFELLEIGPTIYAYATTHWDPNRYFYVYNVTRFADTSRVGPLCQPIYSNDGIGNSMLYIDRQHFVLYLFGKHGTIPANEVVRRFDIRIPSRPREIPTRITLTPPTLDFYNEASTPCNFYNSSLYCGALYGNMQGIQLDMVGNSSVVTSLFIDTPVFPCHVAMFHDTIVTVGFSGVLLFDIAHSNTTYLTTEGGYGLVRIGSVVCWTSVISQEVRCIDINNPRQFVLTYKTPVDDWSQISYFGGYLYVSTKTSIIALEIDDHGAWCRETDWICENPKFRFKSPLVVENLKSLYLTGQTSILSDDIMRVVDSGFNPSFYPISYEIVSDPSRLVAIELLSPKNGWNPTVNWTDSDVKSGKVRVRRLSESANALVIYIRAFNAWEGSLSFSLSIIVARAAGGVSSSMRTNSISDQRSSFNLTTFVVNQKWYLIGAVTVLVILLIVFMGMLWRKPLGAQPSIMDKEKEQDILDSASPTTMLEGQTTYMNAVAELSVPLHIACTATEFVKIKKIAQGGGGIIYTATPKTKTVPIPAKLCVLKEINLGPQFEDYAQRKLFQQEVAVMWYLRSCPQIAQLYAFIESPMTIVMKLYPSGSLDDWLKKESRTKRSSMIFLHDIALGLAAIHGASMVHCDLKPQNVMIDLVKQRPRCVLSDFGTTQIIGSELLQVKAFRILLVNGISVRYAAPEVLASKSADTTRGKSTDIYSLGIVTLDCLC